MNACVGKADTHICEHVEEVVCEDMETHQSIRSKQARSDVFAMPGGINQSRSRNSLQGYMISQVDVVTFTMLSESYRFYDSFGLAWLQFREHGPLG